MSMGKREEKQPPFWVAAPPMPKSTGHRFYQKLNELLMEAGFDQKVEAICRRCALGQPPSREAPAGPAPSGRPPSGTAGPLAVPTA